MLGVINVIDLIVVIIFNFGIWGFVDFNNLVVYLEMVCWGLFFLVFL